MDQVTVDGGPYGTYDGIPDFTDNFGDTVLSPWSTNLGTTTDEADGRLHLKSPGTVVPLYGLQLERSEVVLGGSNFFDADGWSMTIRWVNDPGTELYEGISFAIDIVGGSDIIALAVVNYNAADAAAVGLDEVGLQAFVAHSNSGFAGLQDSGETVLTPAQFTGDVIMQFIHPPGGDVQARLSTNGGSTYIDFGNFTLVAASAISFFIYADPLEGSAPTPTPTCPPPPTPTPVPSERMACYKGRASLPAEVSKLITDDWISAQITVKKRLSRICLPASIDGSPVANPDAVVLCYKAKPESMLTLPSSVSASSELGAVTVQPKKLAEICVPATLP